MYPSLSSFQALLYVLFTACMGATVYPDSRCLLCVRSRYLAKPCRIKVLIRHVLLQKGKAVKHHLADVADAVNAQEDQHRQPHPSDLDPASPESPRSVYFDAEDDAFSVDDVLSIKVCPACFATAQQAQLRSSCYYALFDFVEQRAICQLSDIRQTNSPQAVRPKHQRLTRHAKQSGKLEIGTGVLTYSCCALRKGSRRGGGLASSACCAASASAASPTATQAARPLRRCTSWTDRNIHLAIATSAHWMVLLVRGPAQCICCSERQPMTALRLSRASIQACHQLIST